VTSQWAFGALTLGSHRFYRIASAKPANVCFWYKAKIWIRFAATMSALGHKRTFSDKCPTCLSYAHGTAGEGATGHCMIACCELRP
jgi:hypothetical protein